MISGTSSLNAHQAFVNNTSHNIANVNSKEFSAISSNLSEGSEGSVNLQSKSSNEGTDLNKEMPNLIVGEKGHSANAKSVKTQDEMLGTVLDLKA